jgi:hypothetical protein
MTEKEAEIEILMRLLEQSVSKEKEETFCFFRPPQNFKPLAHVRKVKKKYSSRDPVPLNGRPRQKRVKHSGWDD